MLKLKKLQILGFKSFCDRTELKFHGDGVAAIIGPNGCGKSNIADAVSWVLGEQSAKTLRGSRMEDVIFAGTRERKPTGMAEVSLTLIDPEVYDGADKNEPTELDLKEEMPGEDWDEAELRARARQEVEELTEEAQPGKLEAPASEADEPPSEATNSNSEGAESALGPRVVLKIRRRKFQQQFRSGEIVVTRRLFRSGDSEYLLNGKLCRLRDIQELFMGTGLGPESYALIEQGRIGQILSSRPTDRRAIIEEAAGITKFKTKRRLAEARLEDAKQNLARINDIYEEVTRQMNSLKRQAAKAERYARMREEMRAQLRLVLASKFQQLDGQTAHISGELEAIAAVIERQVESLKESEAELGERTQRGYAIESELRETSARLNEIHLEVDRHQAQSRHNQERANELSVRSAASAAERERAQARLTALEEELNTNRAVLDSATADLRLAEEELADNEQQAAAALQQLSDFEKRQEETRLEIVQALEALSALRNQLTQAEERFSSAERESERLKSDIAAARAEAEAFGSERGQMALRFESVSETIARLERELAEDRRLLEQKRREEGESKDQLDRLRAQYASALGTKSSLEALLAEHGYSTESVRRLFQSGGMQGGLAPVGVLADFLEVEPRYEAVVEDFLRDELNYIVVKSWDAADEGLRLLRSDVDGRATFLVHPGDAQARFSFAIPGERPDPAHDSIVPLKHTIRVLNGFGRSLEVILPKLRDGYIVSDPQFARDLALENPHSFFLAQSGECFHNLTVTGGKQRAEGPLSRKRELREVTRRLGELESALAAEEHRAGRLRGEIEELTSRLEEREAERREAEKQALTSGHALRQMDAELDRLRQRSATSERESGRLAGERATLACLIAERQQKMVELENRRRELEGWTAAAHDELARLRHGRDQAAQLVSETKARVAALCERHRSAASVLERIEQLVGEMQARVGSLADEIEGAARETLERQTQNQQLAEHLVGLASERRASEARAALLEVESEEVRERLSALDGILRAARQELDRLRDQKAELSTLAVKLESDREHLSQMLMNELGLGREELMADSTLTRLSAEELAEKEQACHQMRSRLESMGPVNMMALEEYRETAERQTFLEGQRKDLLDSIANTQATIKEIDTFSRQKFDEAFAKINENFQVTFRKLFGGGQALMRLTDEENTAESGIDVIASPPGKRLQNVLLLSGGEKAMTALALLVGIFQYQPSPFCILDEVDAPLDEANIERFTELVKEMSLKTQFVLITHSKKTMSIAPVLYGVTMQEPGVSKLVSVKFGAA